MKLLMVQHGGDYREAVQRFAAGGRENYYAQRYTVETLAEIGREIGEAGILCYLTKQPYNEVLENGVRAIGAGYQNHKEVDYAKIFKLIEDYNPTHIVFLFPDRPLLKWAIKQNRRVLALLADSSPRKGLKEQFKEFLLANLLNHPRIEWVANHGVTACAWLQAIGVKPNKIVPWDYAYSTTPDDFPIKSLRRTDEPWNLTYVGTMSEIRGVGDLLKAAAQLKAQGLSFKLRMVGRDDDNYLSPKAKQLDIEDCIEFLGMVSIDEIEPLMRQADLVITPTHHDYPAGFPLITYHALRSRTPFIVSDHPMFRSVLEHQVNAMMFPAGNAKALADCIQDVLASPAQYHKLSAASSEAWDRLQIPVKWAALIRRWLANSPEDRQWLHEHRLASGRYVRDWTHQPKAPEKETEQVF
jgi:glycosyltransferase involved in cell wall biosynthesis